MKAAEREAALNASIARHPAGKQIPVQVVILPADLPCMRCNNKQPMDGRIWCTKCADIVDNQPAEPIEAAR